jgi:hypothetical protein
VELLLDVFRLLSHHLSLLSTDSSPEMPFRGVAVACLVVWVGLVDRQLLKIPSYLEFVFYANGFIGLAQGVSP